MADPFKPKFVDLVRTFTTTTGTGAIVPGAAVAGFASFATALVAGDIFYYCIQGIDKPAEREVGRGTLLANGTITRAPISGTATNFTTGNKTIALVAAAEWYARIDDGLTAAASAGAGAGQAAAATRVALAAMVVTAGTTAMLTEAGREGVFRFTSGNQAARVTGDPRQGMVVAPASDTTGATGAWLRIKVGAINVMWFGAVADFVVDDLPAFNAAMAALPTAGGTLTVPAGRYYLSDTLNLHRTVKLTGEGTDWNGGAATLLRFPPNVNGIVVNHGNTHGDTTGTQGSATGSTIEGIALWGGNVTVNSAGVATSFSNGTSTTGHGVRIRTTGVKLRDVNAVCFGGDGFNIVSFAGSGGATEGNANNFQLDFCQSIYNRGNAYFVQGSDSNAGLISICSAISCGGGGFIDYSFLGNTYTACHVRDCGKSDPVLSGGPVGCCNYAGNFYYVVQGQETAASTTVPGTNSAVWQPTTGYAPKLWTSGLTWVNGSCYGTLLSNVNAANVFTGCYAESSQPPVQIGYPSMILGGLLRAAGISPVTSAPYLEGSGGAFNVPAMKAVKAGGGYAYLGEIAGTGGSGDIIGASDGTNSVRLFYDVGGRIQFSANGGYAYVIDGVTGSTPNAFRPRFLYVGPSNGDGNAATLVMTGTAAPITGTWPVGAKVINNTSGTSGPLWWECTVAGTPGTWAAVTGGASTAPNVQAVTSAATVTPVFGNDLVKITAQAAALTIANPTGTAVPGAGLAIRTKDNGTARAISFGTQYRALGVTLPTTTVAGKTLYLGLIYNSDDTKWDVVAVAQEA